MADRNIPVGPLLSRLVATVICGQTGGLADDCYLSYGTDIKLLFPAVDTSLATNKGISITNEYPLRARSSSASV